LTNPSLAKHDADKTAVDKKNLLEAAAAPPGPGAAPTQPATGLPFTLVYDGRPSNEALAAWPRTAETTVLDDNQKAGP